MVDFSTQQQITLDQAWPGFEFEKIDDERASLAVGLFIRGSIQNAPQMVAKRIEDGDYFRDLATYLMTQAGPENCIRPARVIATWLKKKAQPMLDALAKMEAANAALKEFDDYTEGQIEVVGPHTQMLKKMHDQHIAALSGAGVAEGIAASEEDPAEGLGNDPEEDPDNNED